MPRCGRAVEPDICELNSVNVETTVPTQVANTVARHALFGSAVHCHRDLFVFKLRHQPGIVRKIVLESRQRTH